MPDMISLHSPEGTYIYASGHAQELLGYDPAELRETSAYDHSHPDDVQSIAVAHTTVLAGQPATLIYRVRRKDGRYVWVESTMTGRFGPNGGLHDILAATRAVTDRTAVERATEVGRTERSERIQRVIAGGRITPVFQPVVELKSHAVIGYEALARFPDLPEHPTNLWFEEAAELGLTVPLELAALRAELRVLHQLPAEMWLAVNVSPQTLASPQLAQLLQEHGAKRIVLEVVEGAIAGYDELRRVIAPLRRLGAKLAVDDVGAGLSGLQHIIGLAPDIIKLDIALIRGLSADPIKQALAKALVVFSTEINTSVIAEGVETAEDLATLKGLGATHAQGYYLGRPALQPRPIQAECA
jgi:PAS domain S-box-containing protein